MHVIHWPAILSACLLADMAKPIDAFAFLFLTTLSVCMCVDVCMYVCMCACVRVCACYLDCLSNEALVLCYLTGWLPYLARSVTNLGRHSSIHPPSWSRGGQGGKRQGGVGRLARSVRADEPQVACRSAKPGWGAPARAAGAARAPNAARCRADARVLLVLVFGGAGAFADADDAVSETLGAAGHVGAYAPTGARVGAGGRKEDGEGGTVARSSANGGVAGLAGGGLRIDAAEMGHSYDRRSVWHLASSREGVVDVDVRCRCVVSLLCC